MNRRHLQVWVTFASHPTEAVIETVNTLLRTITVRRGASCATALVIAFVTGCGGGDDRSSLLSASKCLVRADGATSVDFATPFHEAMSGGGLRVIFPRNELQLGFGEDGQEARKIGDEVARGIAGTTAARSYSPDELVGVRKNVVLTWKGRPTERERRAVERCLE